MKNTIIGIVSVALALALFCPGTSQSEENPIELTYCTFFPAENEHGRLGLIWAEEIEKQTNGRVKIKYFPDGSLFKGEQIFGAVTDNVIDLGMSTFAYNSARFPVMGAIDLPWGYQSAYTATAVINDYFKAFNPRELSNVKTLYLHAHGPGVLHSAKEVRRLEDLKSMRIRSTGISGKMVLALGGIPVAMSQNAVVTAFKNHYVDATFSPFEVLLAWRQAEVIKETVDCSPIGYTSGMYLVMNRSRWESLPEDIKKVIESVSAEFPAKHAAAWDRADRAGAQMTLSLGNEIVTLPPEEIARWITAVQPVKEEYIEKLTQMGLPGRQCAAKINDLIGSYSKKE